MREDECLRIRERRQVKIGHVAIGISDQVRDSSVIMTKDGEKNFFFFQQVNLEPISLTHTLVSSSAFVK